MKVVEPPKMKVSELKIELIARGLDPNGLKQDLVQRLQAALDEEEFGIAPSISLPSLADSTASITAEPVSPPPPLSPVKAPPSPVRVPTPEPAPVVAAPPSPSPVASSPPPAVEKETPAPASAPVVSKAPAAAAVAPVVETKDQLAEENAKRLARANRFNIPVSVADKIVARAKRFGAVEPAAASINPAATAVLPPGPEEIAAQKLEERIKRFGIVNQQVTTVKKVKTPAGVVLKPEVVSAEELKKRKRMERFGIVEPEVPTKKVSKQGQEMVMGALKAQPRAAVGGGAKNKSADKTAEMLAEEEKRLKRQQRFAPPAK